MNVLFLTLANITSIHEKGIYTDYAIEVSERSGELERMHGK